MLFSLPPTAAAVCCIGLLSQYVSSYRGSNLLHWLIEPVFYLLPRQQFLMHWFIEPRLVLITVLHPFLPSKPSNYRKTPKIHGTSPRGTNFRKHARGTEVLLGPREVARSSCTCRGFLDWHVNSIVAIDSCMASPCVPVRTKRRCAAQTNPTPDRTLTLALTLTQALTLTPTLSGGSRSALEVGRGSVEFTCKSENLAPTYNETPGGYCCIILRSKKKGERAGTRSLDLDAVTPTRSLDCGTAVLGKRGGTHSLELDAATPTRSLNCGTAVPCCRDRTTSRSSHYQRT